ncbi:MAG: peptidylprolyl isomerase [Nitrospirota bacterium]
MKKLAFLVLIYLLLINIHCSLSYGAVLLDRVVAVVNNEVITWSELRERMEIEGKDVLKDFADNEREEKIRELEPFFLDRMIDLKLQIQAADRLGLSVGSSEIDAAVSDIKRKYNLADDEFLKTLKAEGLAMEEYRAQLKEQILLSKAVRYEIKGNIIITDEQIKEYYEKNKDKYGGGEKVRIRQIFFPAAKNADSQKGEIEAKAEEAMRQIKNGKDFSKVAGEFSEDLSKESGGDMGYVSRGSLLKEIEEVVFSLNVGDVSSPFWSSVGLHIVKLEDRTAGVDAVETRDKIKDILFDEAFKLKHEDWINKLREEAYIEKKL